MKCKILHESNGRLRVHLFAGHMSLAQADLTEYYLKQIPGVKDARVYDRTMDAIVLFDAPRADILAALARFSYESAEKSVKVPEHTPRALNRDFEETLISTVFRRFAVKLFFPMPVRTVLSAIRAVKYIHNCFKALWIG